MTIAGISSRAGESRRDPNAVGRISQRDAQSPPNRGAVDAAVVCESRHPVRSLVAGAGDRDIQQPCAKLRYVVRRTRFLVGDGIGPTDCGEQRSLDMSRKIVYVITNLSLRLCSPRWIDS